jgi:hypothetical protein
MKMKKITRDHTMPVKPKLNNDHLLKRLYHCISKIYQKTITGATEMKYMTMHNEVYVDEKWFYLVQDGEQYILTAYEYVAHKSHITKVMFFLLLQSQG